MTEEPQQIEGLEEEEAAPIPLAERRIVYEPQTPSVFDLQRRQQRGKLRLRPSWQRRDVWDYKKQSKFIESVLLDVPLPFIYLAEEEDGTQVVVDGQQRLKALFDFTQGNYALVDGMTLEEINGKRFSDLPESYQDAIENRALPMVLIKKESAPNVKTDVFERLNTGAVQLNAQELRNCIFMGSFNQLLLELSEDPLFQQLLAFERPDRRMKDVELVLRFFAFYHGYGNYNKPLKRFLDDEMKPRRDISDTEKRRLRDIFLRSLRLAQTAFGNHVFRRFEASEAGGRWAAQPNVFLYEVVMYGFAKRADQERALRLRSDSIREALIILLTQDVDFQEALTRHTSDEERVKKRFSTWMNEIDAIIATAGRKEPRLFSLQLKQQLFDRDPTCKQCGQRIHLLDDAHVDHVDPYWRGGHTIPENAQLLHRYCNSKKGSRPVGLG